MEPKETLKATGSPKHHCRSLWETDFLFNMKYSEISIWFCLINAPLALYHPSCNRHSVNMYVCDHAYYSYRTPFSYHFTVVFALCALCMHSNIRLRVNRVEFNVRNICEKRTTQNTNRTKKKNKTSHRWRCKRSYFVYVCVYRLKAPRCMYIICASPVVCTRLGFR